MGARKTLDRRWLHIVVPVTLVVIAAGLRVWPLQNLELRIPYVTFYPAVMIAGLYGGIAMGIVTMTLSALTIVFWSPTGHPFIIDTGDWLGMAVFAVNCTMISIVAEAMLRAQARAKAAQAQAEAANRAKSVFLATMSHELRTPLNAILGFSNLMRDEPGLSDHQRETLDIINRSGAHLLSLIDNVLDMAKIEAGRSTLEIAAFDLGALIRDITDMLGEKAREKGLALLLDESSEFPRFIKGDAAKLRQVIVNLVSNAVKYTEQGNVTLRVGAQSAGGALRLLIEVKDTGMGISRADQAHIFEPFVQAGQTASQKGTGLGLAIVREYVTSMGGSVSVASTPGEGSLFRFDIPAQVAAEADVMQTVAAQGRVVGLEPGQPEYRILIVDDQRENSLLLRRLLEGAGFLVDMAENGAEGVEKFRSFHPHFIWMDRRMPIMDGLEATRRIRALDGGRTIKIVCVSASAFGDQRAEMQAAGMDDFVRKPYRPDEIFECMGRHLGLRYIRTNSAPETELASPLPREALARLPADLRRDLANGLVLGNTKRIGEVMRRIEQADPALAKALARHVATFDYLPMLAVLETADNHPGEPSP